MQSWAKNQAAGVEFIDETGGGSGVCAEEVEVVIFFVGPIAATSGLGWASESSLQRPRSRSIRLQGLSEEMN